MNAQQVFYGVVLAVVTAATAAALLGRDPGWIITRFADLLPFLIVFLVLAALARSFLD